MASGDLTVVASVGPETVMAPGDLSVAGDFVVASVCLAEGTSGNFAVVASESVELVVASVSASTVDHDGGG